MTQQTLPSKSLKMINVKLMDIWVDRNLLSHKLQAQIRHISNSIPTLTMAGLRYLELTQPLIVVEQKQENARYRLVAGIRTYQLLIEQRDRKSECLALTIKNLPADEILELSAFDAIIPKVVQIPNDAGKALIGYELSTNVELHSQVSKFINIDGKVEIARILGIKRTTLHSFEKSIREYKSALKSNSDHTGLKHIVPTLDDEEWKD